jgi:hypothetical protein
MKYRGLLLSALLLTLLWGTEGNKHEAQHSERAVSVPREISLPVIAYQPNCPLKVSYIDLRRYLDGGGQVILKYRNEGDKPIKGYTVAYVTSLGTGMKSVVTRLNPNEWIKPGEELHAAGPFRDQLIPLTDELRKELDLKGPMQGIFVFVMIRVEFSDGSVYDDEKVYEALKAHFEKLSKCME